MRRMGKFIWPAIMALLITGVDIAFRKSGKGGTSVNHGVSLSWAELTAFFPEFLVVFLVSFGGALLYSLAVKNEKNYTCPQCGKAFSHQGFSVAMCPACQVRAEPSKGFHDRHPELRNRQ